MARPPVADVRWVPCHHGMARPQVADVRWVPCHHGMALPHVEDGGDGLHLWRIAANILNKQWWTTDLGWSSSLGVGRAANSSPKKISLLRKIRRSLGPGRVIWINDLS
jgi:hypothetical protein